MLGLDRTTIEHEIESTQVMLLGDIETKLVLLVKGFLAPLFQVFDFVEVGDPIYAQMVNDFVAGLCVKNGWYVEAGREPEGRRLPDTAARRQWRPRRSGEPRWSPAASGGPILEPVTEEDF
jgi:hypothetical protein